MQGREIFRLLERIGATHLYHANSVTTSCTFLVLGGLASRRFVDDHSLKQTPQVSDEKDKKYGVWSDIFLDHVDIHYRSGGRNQYGPVLFQFGLDILLGLPASAEIRVTKTNPIHWDHNDSNRDRWFRDANEVVKHIHFGDFGKMLVIKTPSEKLDFPDQQARITLDNPRRKVSSGQNAYSFAKGHLRTAAATGRVETHIKRRNCLNGCACVKEYSDSTTQQIDGWFS